MDHPADFVEPSRPLRGIRELRYDFLQKLPAQDDLLRIRSVWSEISNLDPARSWPVSLEHGVLIVEAAGTAAQDLRLQASQVCKRLESLGIRVKKILVEMGRKRG
jgi:hypothetical protein